jgi:hypothetical protein
LAIARNHNWLCQGRQDEKGSYGIVFGKSTGKSMNNRNSRDYNAGFTEFIGQASAPEQGSDRAFGLLFAAFFALIGLGPILDGNSARIWALDVAVVLIAFAILCPYVFAAAIDCDEVGAAS